MNDEPTAARVPCPSCSEGVLPTATVCPHCKNAILSRDKNTNAVASLVILGVTFVGLYFMLSEFVGCEGRRGMASIEQSAKP